MSKITVDCKNVQTAAMPFGDVANWTAFCGQFLGFVGLFLKTCDTCIYFDGQGGGHTWAGVGNYNSRPIHDYQPVDLHITATPCGGE